MRRKYSRVLPCQNRKAISFGTAASLIVAGACTSTFGFGPWGAESAYADSIAQGSVQICQRKNNSSTAPAMASRIQAIKFSSTGKCPRGFRLLGTMLSVKDTEQVALEIFNRNKTTIQGQSGAEGPTGPRGPTGAAGQRGDTGATGPQGLSGIAGAQGPTGPQGASGPQGLSGSTGPIGPQGIAGPQGASGARGETGPVGPAGVPGATGAQGPIGPQGHTGATGLPGPQGPTGPQGAVGLQGATGPRGETGATGPQGVVGPVGATGATGSIGPVGPIGPIGPIGPVGPRGAAGERGATGAQGPIGLTGPIGATGPQGIAGPIGATGQVGAVGPRGDTGDRGATGPQGPVGSTGTIGATGPQGPQGQVGPTGATGPTLNLRWGTDWFDWWDIDLSSNPYGVFNCSSGAFPGTSGGRSLGALAQSVSAAHGPLVPGAAYMITVWGELPSSHDASTPFDTWVAVRSWLGDTSYIWKHVGGRGANYPDGSGNFSTTVSAIADADGDIVVRYICDGTAKLHGLSYFRIN